LKTEEKIQIIVQKLKDYLGNRVAVIGVSGGIDSAVVAGLCSQAIGPDKILAVMMPNHKQRAEDGLLVCKTFGIKMWHIIGIEKFIEAYKSWFSKNELSDKLVLGNIQARIRMSILYANSNINDGMVIGTGNKSEMAVGYFTKYGDGGVDVEPIGDIYKTEVFEMAKILGVPEKIINKPPSAELWDNQTDEDEIGMTYDDLDRILKYIYNPGFSSDDEFIAVQMFGADKVNRVQTLIAQSEHKRNLPPVFEIE